MGGSNGGSGSGGRSSGGGGFSGPNAGLQQIQAQIKAAGGAEAFVESTKSKSLSQEDRKQIGSDQMGRISNLYMQKSDFKTPIKTEGSTKFYANKDNSMIMAKVRGKPAAYVLKAEGYTTIVTAKEYAGKGLGKKTMKEFYNKNPDYVTKTGGFTPAGKKAFTSVMKDIQAGIF
jgi:hypothetical protein